MSADGSIYLPLKGKTVRMADLFCGAGGTSSGALRAVRKLGGTAKLAAVNHWPPAIDTHSRMHPEAVHFCADLEHVRPRTVVPAGVLDLLMASPTCTYHSRARGGRPVHDQQRMDPWHVTRWCTELRVHRLFIENVPEFMQWGKCSIVTGRPIKSERGGYFRAWLDSLRAVGFTKLDYRVVCCADYGDATTRERFLLIANSTGRPLRWPAPGYARNGTGGLKPWRGACEIIDWSLRGTSIFRRARPLRPNTIRRILAGAIRYNWPQPYIDALQALLEGRKPVLRIPRAALLPYGISSEEPRFVVDFRGTERSHLQGSAHDLSQPLSAITANGNHHALVMATGSGGAARSALQPIPAITGGGDGGARPHLIQPLIAPYYGSGSGKTSTSAADPLDTITTKARFGLAEPLIVTLSNSSNAGVPRPVSQPVNTITTARGGDKALASPVIEGEICDEIEIDILYRMLVCDELARATSFDDEGIPYEFSGTIEDITRQIGNAVPVRTAEAHIRALLEA